MLARRCGKAPKQKASAREKALAERAAREWNDYVTRFAPAEDALLAKLRDTEGAIERGRAEAGKAAAEAFGGDDAAYMAGGLRVGQALNSGSSVLGLADRVHGLAGAAGQGAAGAERAAKERELKGLLKMAAFGRGLADDSTLSLARAGREETTAASENMFRKIDRGMWLQRGLGQAVGAGVAGLDLRKKWES